jgi:deoxyribonuclease V
MISPARNASGGAKSRRDDFAQPLRTVAGFAARLEGGADGAADAVVIVHAAAVLLDADTLDVLDRQRARTPLPASARPAQGEGPDLPALLQALAQLSRPPDLAFVAGHGIAHPRRLGLAARFGAAAGVPSIGVATQVAFGTAATLHEIRGAHTPLRDGREQVGWLLRSRPGSPPLVVSPGHRVSMTSSAQLVMRYAVDDRLPEPVRFAEALAAGA